MPMRVHSANRSVSRAAPSSMEYSVWTCRCTKDSVPSEAPPRVAPLRVVRLAGMGHRLLQACCHTPGLRTCGSGRPATLLAAGTWGGGHRLYRRPVTAGGDDTPVPTPAGRGSGGSRTVSSSSPGARGKFAEWILQHSRVSSLHLLASAGQPAGARRSLAGARRLICYREDTLMRRPFRTLTLTAAAGLLAAMAFGVTGAIASGNQNAGSGTTTPIKHLVVIFDENISFDHYFGTYPFAANPA